MIINKVAKVFSGSQDRINDELDSLMRDSDYADFIVTEIQITSLYKPSAVPQGYENPDEDYGSVVLTVFIVMEQAVEIEEDIPDGFLNN